MAISYTTTRNKQHGTITISDGTGTPKTLQIPISPGDLQFSASPNPGQVVMNRDVLSHFTIAPQTPVTGRLSIKFTEWKGKGLSGANPSVYDAMTKTGNASSWVSTSTCGPYTTDMTFAIANPCSGAGTGIDQAESLLFSDVLWGPFNFAEASDTDTIEIPFTALVTAPSSTRSGS
ncbi:MAG: hypothetical protein EKK55_01090 [Rhodocyclaceae bacterium]|nr:MAG: hypothetical protein EKK55_01090 [Rhodocyclaceae bacterium]